MADRLAIAKTRIVKIRQESEKRFGHYDTVRRHTTGIIQACELGIISASTLTALTEKLMMDAPNYWLAPCLVALAAWINNAPELADKALREAIKRDDEKTSLLFALICRRADRNDACLKWTQRYLANQDNENLDWKCIMILNAFTGGLLNPESEGFVSQQLVMWMDSLSKKPGFAENWAELLSNAINAKRKPFKGENYTNLSQHSTTWQELQGIMEGAHLHATIFEYFESIFGQNDSYGSLKNQLDNIMTVLVTDYENEELALKKEELLEQLIIEFNGDESKAKASMAHEITAFGTRIDFAQLLADAAMNPESSNASVSTQKFAIALSLDLIIDAYNNVVAKNRMQIPHEIEINFEGFNDITTDGQNETELLSKFSQLIAAEKNTALSKAVLSGFDIFCLWGGIVIAGIGIAAIVFSEIDIAAIVFEQVFPGMLTTVAGIGMVINHFSKRKKVKIARQCINSQFEKKLSAGIQIIKATLAEVVNLRSEFYRRDGESQKVSDYLNQISPDRYLKRLSKVPWKIKAEQ